jgi:hypothetical protein
MSSDTNRRDAEDALWRYLNGPWAQENRQVRGHPTRALQALGPAYRNGRLLEDMTKWAPVWNGDTSRPQFAAMVEMTWLGVRTWEEVLLMPDMPWSQYVTPEQRRGLKRVVDACRAHAGRRH